MIALSTAWNNDSDISIPLMLNQIKELGFKAIEISYKFTPQRLEELIRLLQDEDVKVTNVHNFCPLPAEERKRYSSDYYRLSSQNEDERLKAVLYTKRSIDTACRLAAPVVVLHTGTVELETGLGRELIRLYTQGKAGTDEFIGLRERLLVLRRSQRSRFIDATIKSLEEIVAYAHAFGVKVALETRYYFNEIPDIEEIQFFLDMFKDQGLCYWHDTGHAELNERLGMARHLDFLEKFKDYTVGMHIHDIIGVRDHFAPFTGEMDFGKIMPYLRDDVIKVLEVHSHSSAVDIKKSVELLTRY